MKSRADRMLTKDAGCKADFASDVREGLDRVVVAEVPNDGVVVDGEFVRGLSG